MLRRKNMVFTMPRATALILVFLIPLVFGEEVTELLNDEVTELANDDAIYMMAIVFLVLCIIVLVIALVVPMMLYRQLKIRNSSSMGSKYKMSERRVTTTKRGEETGFYGAYNAPEQQGSIYPTVFKQTTDRSMHRSTYAPSQDIPMPLGITLEYKKGPTKKRGSKAAYDNPVIKDVSNVDTEL